MRERQISVALAFVLFVFAAIALVGPGRPIVREGFCAGVGLTTDTYGATPREALEAYVRSRGGDPKYWRMSGTSGFEITEGRARPKGLASIGASEESPGVWRVSGGCVGNYESTQAARPVPPLSRSTCEQSDFRITVAEGRAHAPFATWEVTLTNVSQRTCVVEGYPHVTMVANAYTLSFSILRRSGVLIAAPQRRDVSVAAGGHAFFALEKDACSPSDTIVANKAEVHVSGWSKPVTAAVPGRFALCGLNSYDGDLVVQTPLVGNVSDAYLTTPAAQRCRSRDLEPQDAGFKREADGYTAWVVRLVNVGTTSCELRGTPRLAIGGSGGSLFGIGAKQATSDRQLIRGGHTDNLRLAPRASGYIAFEKYRCERAEQEIVGIGFRPPADGGSDILPFPPGLAKCDFKEPAGNTIWYSPFVASTAEALTT